MNAADRPKALIGFPAEVESRLKEVVMVQQMITIQQVIGASASAADLKLC